MNWNHSTRTGTHQKVALVKKKSFRIRLWLHLADMWVKSDGLGITVFWIQVPKLSHRPGERRTQGTSSMIPRRKD